MKRPIASLMAVLVVAGLVVVGCTQAAPAPTPTKAAAAAPTTAPAGATAPAKAAEPTKPSAAQPTTAAAAPTKKVDFPQKGKAVTLIVPWAAGSSNDLCARLLAGYMEKDLGTPFEVVNKTGASTQVGMTELARAKPDGYTLGLTSTITTVLTYMDPTRKAAFAMKDFQPVAVTVSEAVAMSVKADSPYKTLKEMVDFAKANPKKLKLGDNGLGSPTHMVTLMLSKVAGAQFASVHFDGGSQNVAAMMGGHLDVSSASPSNVIGLMKNNEVRVLGIADDEENKLLPGVKTFASQGFNVVMPLTRGVVAPAGTPKEVVEILAASMKKATQDPEYIKKSEDTGQGIRFIGTEDFQKHWASLEQPAKDTIEEVQAEATKK